MRMCLKYFMNNFQIQMEYDNVLKNSKKVLREETQIIDLELGIKTEQFKKKKKIHTKIEL